MNVRYRVELNQAERSKLTALLSGGKHAARKLKRAQILLAADAGALAVTRLSASWTPTEIHPNRRFSWRPCCSCFVIIISLDQPLKVADKR